MNQIGKEEIAEKGDCLKQNAGADREKQAVHEKRHENRYAEDKPKDCSYCFFWKKNAHFLSSHFMILGKSPKSNVFLGKSVSRTFSIAIFL